LWDFMRPGLSTDETTLRAGAEGACCTTMPPWRSRRPIPKEELGTPRLHAEQMGHQRHHDFLSKSRGRGPRRCAPGDTRHSAVQQRPLPYDCVHEHNDVLGLASRNWPPGDASGHQTSGALNGAGVRNAADGEKEREWAGMGLNGRHSCRSDNMWTKGGVGAPAGTDTARCSTGWLRPGTNGDIRNTIAVHIFLPLEGQAEAQGITGCLPQKWCAHPWAQKNWFRIPLGGTAGACRMPISHSLGTWTATATGNGGGGGGARRWPPAGHRPVLVSAVMFVRIRHATWKVHASTHAMQCQQTARHRATSAHIHTTPHGQPSPPKHIIIQHTAPHRNVPQPNNTQHEMIALQRTQHTRHAAQHILASCGICTNAVHKENTRVFMSGQGAKVPTQPGKSLYFPNCKKSL